MSYWQDRMATAQTNLSTKNIQQIENKLKKYYERAMKKVISDFESVYDKILLQQATGELPTANSLYKLDAYWKMQGQLRNELQKLGDKQIAALSKIFETNFFEVYYSIALNGADPFTTIDVAAAQQIINQIWCADGLSWSQRIWNNTNLLVDTLNEGLVECVIAGKKTTELKKILQYRFAVSYSKADSLVRTEMAHIQTQAARQRYADYGVAEVQIWADADERRCPECGKLHKKKFKIGEAVPIPKHPRCRCCIIPVIEDAKEEETYSLECQQCGKTFISYNEKTLYCPECKQERYLTYRRKNK